MILKEFFAEWGKLLFPAVLVCPLAVLLSSCEVTNFGPAMFETGITYEAARIDEADSKTLFDYHGEYYVKATLAQYERDSKVLLNPLTTTNPFGKTWHYKKLSDSFPERKGYYRVTLDLSGWHRGNKAWTYDYPLENRWVDAKNFDERSARKVKAEVRYLRPRQSDPVVMAVTQKTSWYHYPMVPVAILGGCVDIVLSIPGGVIACGHVAAHGVNEIARHN